MVAVWADLSSECQEAFMRAVQRSQTRGRSNGFEPGKLDDCVNKALLLATAEESRELTFHTPFTIEMLEFLWREIGEAVSLGAKNNKLTPTHIKEGVWRLAQEDVKQSEKSSQRFSFAGRRPSQPPISGVKQVSFHR